jgi:aminomethyltransferase
LNFALSKRRLAAGSIRGHRRLADELADGPHRVRVGLRVMEGAPAREGAIITTAEGSTIGTVTSGGFSPTLSVPIAMGYVEPSYAEPGTNISVIVRGRAQPAEVTALPFVPHRYVRKSQ